VNESGGNSGGNDGRGRDFEGNTEFLLDGFGVWGVDDEDLERVG